MAGNRKFHNKFHSANHHTLPSPHIVDSGLDPIASHDFPFIGDFVLNGVVSANNTHPFNNGDKGKSSNKDTGLTYEQLNPVGWNIFRDSMLVDGDVTITGNLTALGELTYLHTQVHAKSATEIEVLADNTNGKTAALTVDQYGTNDIVHFKNDSISTFLITGSADGETDLGGWIGVNLGNLDDTNRPNQRMTLVGSVSVVPDPNEVADQNQQADAGTSGSIYVEGGLHVNDHTYLDQVTIDTTDGKFLVSGGNNDASANILDVDVPTELDKLTVDTSDGKFYIHGGNNDATANILDVDVPTELDKLTVDTSDGKFYIHGDNNDANANILDVDVPTELDKLTVDTTDDRMVVSGTNNIYINTDPGIDIDTHTQVDQLTVDTTDGDMVIEGDNKLHITTDQGVDVDTPADFDEPVNIDKLTVDTTDGKFYVHGGDNDANSNIFDVDVPTELDKLTVDTNDGQFYVHGDHRIFVQTTSGVVIDSHTQLDQVTINTDDGDTYITGNNKVYIDTAQGLNVDTHTRLDQTTIDTGDGELHVHGPSGVDIDTHVDIDEHTHLDQLTVDTDDGPMSVTGDNKLYINTSELDVESVADFDEHVQLDQVTIDTDDGDTNIIGDNKVYINTTDGLVVDTHTQLDQLTVNTDDGDANITGSNKIYVDAAGGLDVDTHTQLDQVTIDTDNGKFYIDGYNIVDIDTHAQLDQVTINTTDGNTEIVGDNGVLINAASGLVVDTHTQLDQLTVNTDDGDTLITGSGNLDVQTPTFLNKTTVDTLEGDMIINGPNMLDVNVNSSFVGTLLTAEAVDIVTSLNNNFNVLGSGLMSVDVEATFTLPVNVNKFTANTTLGAFRIINDLSWENRNGLIVDVPTTLASVSASTDNDAAVFHGEKPVYFKTQTIFEQHSQFVSADISLDLNVDGQTTLDQTTIDTTDGDFVVEGTGTTTLATPVVVDNNLHVTGNLRVDGNAYLSAGVDGTINVGDQDTDDIVFNSRIASDLIPDSNKTFNLGTNTLNWNNAYVCNIISENVTTDILSVDSIGANTINSTYGTIDTLNSITLTVDDSVHVGGDVVIDGTLTVNSDILVQSDKQNNINIGNDIDQDFLRVNAIIDSSLIADNTNHTLGTDDKPWGESYIVNSKTSVHTTTSQTVETVLTSNGLTELSATNINTSTGNFNVSGSGKSIFDTNVIVKNDQAIEGDLDVDGHVQLDQVTVDTDDGLMAVAGDNKLYINTSEFDVDSPTDFDEHVQLDQVTIDTNDGDFVVEGDGQSTIKTDLNITGAISATNGPWLFTGCDLRGYTPGSINVGDPTDGEVHNVEFPQLPEHPFKVDCRSLFSTGLTARGPVQIGELPEGVTDNLQEPTLEVLGNVQILDGNLHLMSDIRHVDDQDTLIRFNPDQISFVAGGVDILTLTEKTSSNGNDIVTIGNSDQPVDFQLFRKDHDEPGLDYNSSTGKLTLAGDLSANQTVNIRNLVVDYLTVHESSLGNVGGGMNGSTEMNVLSGVANKDHQTVHYVNGNTQSFDGTETGIVYDVLQDDTSTIQNFFSFTFEALTDDTSLGIVAGDTQTLNYHFVARWDDYYSQAQVNDTTSHVIHTSDNPIATVTSVVLSASDVPTNERIVKIIVQPAVDVEFWTRNVLIQDKPKRLDTVTTADFEVDGDLTVTGDTNITGHTNITGDTTINGVLTVDQHLDVGRIIGSLEVEDNLHVQGDLTVDGNLYLSGGTNGTINVGDTSQDTVNFYADIDSDFKPSIDAQYNLGSYNSKWNKIYINDVIATQMVQWSGGNSELANSVYNSVLSTSGDWDSTHASVLATSGDWDSTHASVNSTSANWDSTHASVLATSANWDSTHASVLATSGDWDSTHASVLATSANWDSTHASVNSTSANWDSTHASVLATSGDWDSTHASVLATSGDWNSTHASVLATSGRWNTAYSYVNSSSATNNVDYNRTTFVNTSGDNITGNLSIDGHLEATTAVFTSITALSSVVDVIDIKVRELSGYDIIDGDLTVGGSVSALGDIYLDKHSLIFSDNEIFTSQDSKDAKNVYNSVLATSSDWDSTHASVLATSSNWDSTYSSVNNISANWDSTHASVNSTSANWDSTHASVLATSSDWDSTHASVLATSSNWDSTHASVLATSGDWDSTHASVLATSSDWDSTYASVLATSGDWDSTHASVNSTSANWDSTHASVNSTSANWDSTHASVLATSGDWDSTHASVLATSGDWDSTHASVLATSSDWDSTHASVLATSGDWDNTHASVLATSGDWNSVYNFVNTTSGDSGYATLSADINGKLVLRDDQVPPVAITNVFRVENPSLVAGLTNRLHRGDIVLVSSTEDNLIATTDYPTGEYHSNLAAYSGFEKLFAPNNMVRFINGYQGPSVTLDPDDLDDIESEHKFVSQTDIENWDSTNASVFNTSGDWDSVYSFVNADSATNNTDYNRTTFVNVTGDTITGDLEISNRITSNEAVFTSLTALSSVIDVVDIKVRELSGYDIIDGDLSVDGTLTIGDQLVDSIDIFNFKSVHSNVLSTSANWDSVYNTVKSTSANWDSIYNTVNSASGDWDSTHASVLATSSDWDSTHASVLATSGDWDSTYSSVNNTSANWDSTHASVLATSSDWDSTHASVLATSSDWDSTHASVLATSSDWDSTHASVLATSSDWDSTHASVLATSSNWDSTHASVLATSSNWDSTHASVLATSSNWDSTHASVLATSSNWDSTHASVLATSSNWDSTHASVLATSSDWNSVYSFVNADSGTNNTDYNRTTFVNASGDTVTGDLSITGQIEATTAVFTSITALSSVVDVIDIKVRELSGYDIIDGDLTVGGSISALGDIYLDKHSLIFSDGEVFTSQDSKDAKSVYTSVLATSSDWDSTHASVLATSGNWDSTHASVLATSGDWDSTHASVLATSGDWDSTYASVNSTSSDWDSTHASVLATSGDWDSTHASVLATSGDWDSTHASVLATSGEWDSTHASVLATSGDWDSTHASVLATSGEWDSTHASVLATSGDWDSTHASVLATSADWDSTHASVLATSADWDSTHASVLATSADWDSTHASVLSTSSNWDNVYNYVKTTSGEGYAILDANGKLLESQIPNLSISEVYTVADPLAVEQLCSGNTSYGDVDLQRGDVIIVTSPPHTLIAAVDAPQGTWTDNSGNPGNDDTFAGFVKVTTPTDYVFSVNGKNGYQIILNPDDLDDTQTAHKFVEQQEKDNWNSTHTSVFNTSGNWDGAYSFVSADSATNNTDYNQTTFVNASGDTVTGDLEITNRITSNEAVFTSLTALSSVIDVVDIKVRELSGYDIIDGDLSVDGDITIINNTMLSGRATIDDTLTVNQDVLIKGDLHVDGNTYLSGGVDGIINIGDKDTDSVTFHADVNSDIVPDVTDIFSLGNTTKRWNSVHAVSAFYDEVDIDDLNVSGVTTLSGKTDRGPGLVIKGTPTGIFDVNTPGFEDRDGDYLIPDVDITGDVVLHGSMSADEAHIYSLTASNFRAEYQKLVVNDGDLDMLNGTFRQRGGDMLIDGTIGHIDDENTYIRFSQDTIKFVCHDLNMIQFNEYPVDDDIIIIGDITDAVDIKIQNPTDEYTFFINGDDGRIAIGNNNPQDKLHITGGVIAETGHVDMVESKSLAVPVGNNDERVDKVGSIRWNTDLYRYEGYNSKTGNWIGLSTHGDIDHDTYITVDAAEDEYINSDQIGMFTAGCSAMTIYPDQTVAFAGDIRFDNVTVYDEESATGPLIATSEFIYLKVNGKDRAIRLWETPADTREDIVSVHGEHIVDIGAECATGLEGTIPVQTISAQDVLASPPTEGTDSDGDGIVDSKDSDDDGDGILDYADADHPSNIGEPDSDNDGVIDAYDSGNFEETDQWQDGDNITWDQMLTDWDTLTGE